MEYRGKLSWRRLSKHFDVSLDGLRKIIKPLTHTDLLLD